MRKPTHNAFLNSLRKEYAGLYDSAHKQLGLRALRDAETSTDAHHVADLMTTARFHLPYAKAKDAAHKQELFNIKAFGPVDGRSFQI